jgi:hypothetical protein
MAKAANPFAKGKPWTAKADMAADKKAGIKEGSKKDLALDKARGVDKTSTMRAAHKAAARKK